MNEVVIPEVFALFEKKVAHVLSFKLTDRKAGLDSAIVDLLSFFSSIVARGVNAEIELALRDALIKRLVDALEELMDGFEIEGDAKLDGLLAEYCATVSRAENIINESAE